MTTAHPTRLRASSLHSRASHQSSSSRTTRSALWRSPSCFIGPAVPPVTLLGGFPSAAVHPFVATRPPVTPPRPSGTLGRRTRAAVQNLHAAHWHGRRSRSVPSVWLKGRPYLSIAPGCCNVGAPPLSPCPWQRAGHIRSPLGRHCGTVPNRDSRQPNPSLQRTTHGRSPVCGR